MDEALFAKFPRLWEIYRLTKEFEHERRPTDHHGGHRGDDSGGHRPMVGHPLVQPDEVTRATCADKEEPCS